MCYTATKYHLRCSHYGKTAISGERCIRAASQTGLSQGCWDTIDLGLESVDTLCPKCVNTTMLTPVPEVPLIGPASLEQPSLITMRSSSDKSGGLNSRPSNTRLGSVCSDASVSTNESLNRMESTSNVSASTSDSSRGSGSPSSLHWRSFGGSEVSIWFKRSVKGASAGA